MKVRTVSKVPGLTEHPHPVASHDFRDVGGRVAVAYQFRGEDWEVRYRVEMRDVLESIGLIVLKFGRKIERFGWIGWWSVVGRIADGPVWTNADVIDSHETNDIINHIDILRNARLRGKGPGFGMGGILSTPLQKIVYRVQAD